ncbi:MAG: GIY-YIG nuclease family protein [Candidatus Nomurabacteria bacterium]|nr:GIY-YIG nuclease family protein [Candidatus Nomurabacteria bacterium]
MNSQDFEKFDLPDGPGVYFFAEKVQVSASPQMRGGGDEGRRGIDTIDQDNNSDTPQSRSTRQLPYIGEQGHVLYIGKATSLHDRVRSYFSGDIATTRGPKITKMIDQANTITWQETDSVLEALLLESQLIKKHQPEYNTRDKDNKSYNYVVITDEDFPRVFTVRERELLRQGTLDFKTKHTFGPFTNGDQLREALRIIRKIFPFRDKKAGQTNQERFYQLLGLSPDVASATAKLEYAKTIKHIKLFFEGKKKAIVTDLERQMKKQAKDLKFEQANIIKKQIFALQHIHDVSLIKTEYISTKNFRIESYDIAHMSGQNTVGVMTVVENGQPEPNEYRKFKIRGEGSEKANDTLNLAEIIQRRFEHPEWSYPQLIVVDGGKAQKNRAEKTLREMGIEIPVVSVVKDDKHRAREILGLKKYREQNEREILLSNAEAHRFAINYHKNLRRKNLK